MRGILALTSALCAIGLRAQDDLIAYVPERPAVRTADSDAIAIIGSEAPGVYRFALPEGTYAVDVLNAHGRPLDPQPHIEDGNVDLRAMKAGTYTLRAHTFEGIHIRRFGLTRPSGMAWTITP